MDHEEPLGPQYIGINFESMAVSSKNGLTPLFEDIPSRHDYELCLRISNSKFLTNSNVGVKGAKTVAKQNKVHRGQYSFQSHSFQNTCLIWTERFFFFFRD